jgi:hypothetical protein
LQQKAIVAANLTWINFKELLVDKFMREYQNLCEEMNLVQMRHTGLFTAYVRYLNTQINATPKINKFSRKYIFLAEIGKMGGGCFVQVPKPFEDVMEIVKIFDNIEANGPKKK